ncbi:Oxyanion-translocating ATPase [Halanaeroarchaeum sp. HSR-CO]|uniref:ArsA family ATPase n=1 Tax=Halanaeroarchaeum sp. HSR-CO TaxID=2866382 RepID=UPI00217E274C|nr:ArsA family ATPase [Halanaeroarchaeum sp. HSR-CO]UWG46472.1 Oxyanion-translocating ATPase [Halanaeroarchaeum sp. HSR-CO]
MEKFVFFGGKGGVGKTTVSSAYGLKNARAGLRTLLVSTDPAHSTSDVFGQQFDDEPSSVQGVENLYAMEIDPEDEVQAHLMEIKQRMADQVSPSIVNAINSQIELAHKTPGAYEAALFDRFIQVMREADDFDRVVFDTSPTGGTLRLLSLPAFLEDWIDRLIDKRAKSIDLFEKAAIGEKKARQRAETDPIIAHLKERKEKFEFAGEKLRNQSAFYLVMNPDDLSMRETERAIEQLDEYGIAVDGLVINKITPAPDEDETGVGARYLRDRVATERERIGRIRADFDRPVVATIESRVEEIRDELLDDVAAELDIGVGVETAAEP